MTPEAKAPKLEGPVSEYPRPFFIYLPSGVEGVQGWESDCSAHSRQEAAAIFAKRLDEQSFGQAGWTGEDLFPFVGNLADMLYRQKRLSK